MLEEWRKFRAWLVLQYFAENPNKKIHLKGLSRELSISPRTAELYCKLYEKNDVLFKQVFGNATVYFLNNDNILVKQFKKIFFLMKFKESGFLDAFLEQNPNIVSVAVFGAFANGEYSQESDIDLLVIYQGKKIETKKVALLEEFFKKTVELTLFSVGEWQEKKRRKEDFVSSILKNNLLLWGMEL